jgi:hypothetical protein
MGCASQVWACIGMDQGSDFECEFRARRIRVAGNFAHKLFCEIIQMHAYEMHTYEIYAYEIHAYGIHAHEIHAYEMHTYETYTYEMQAYIYLSPLWAIPRLALAEPAFPGNHT